MQKYELKTQDYQTFMDPNSYGDYEFYLAADVDAHIAELKEALRKYGGHKEECQQIQGWGATERNPCDCGFAELINL